MAYDLVGRIWTAETFADYVDGLNLTWASGVTMHHTAAPSLAQRPAGLKAQHIINIRDHYRLKLGWSRGPHLFIDEDQIFGMSSLEERGIHAKSFNATHIGIEVLGDYDTEDPATGRGKQCWKTAALAAAIIIARLGKTTAAINFHRDDPRTSKTCPGKKVSKETFRELVDNAGPPAPATDDRANQPTAMHAALDSIEWQLKKLRDLAGPVD